MRSATLDSSIAGAPVEAWAACEAAGSAAVLSTSALPPRATPRTTATAIVPMATFFHGLDGAFGGRATAGATCGGRGLGRGRLRGRRPPVRVGARGHRCVEDLEVREVGLVDRGVGRVDRVDRVDRVKVTAQSSGMAPSGASSGAAAGV